MTANKTFLGLLSIFSCFIGSAQLDQAFDSAKVLTIGDLEINGFVRQDDLSTLASGVCLKQNLSDKKCQIYNPSQIISFETEKGEVYESLDLKLDNNKIEIKVFANLILRGHVSLFKSANKSEVFYAIKKDNNYYVLQNDKLVSGEGEVRRYNFKGILIFATENLLTDDIEHMSFNENDFVDIIKKYNSLKGSYSKDLRVTEENTSYFVVNAGAGFKSNGSEYYAQAFYRKYYPKISRSTSINFGISYFNYQYLKYDTNYKASLISVPVQIQQNFLNKNIRPYVFTGFSLNYLNVTNDDDESIISTGLQKNYGINFMYGAGLEIDMYKGFFVKSEFRHESFSHLILFGVGYTFKN